VIAMNVPSYGNLKLGGYGDVKTAGFGDAYIRPKLAGGFLDKEKLQEFKDVFGSEIGALAYLQEKQRQEASDPQRIQQTLNVLGPWYKDIARENQRLGMESNIFAGIMDLPNKLSRAMAAQHYYMPETMQTISQNIGRPTPFATRQYVNL
jgi:hypothetical protein